MPDRRTENRFVARLLFKPIAFGAFFASYFLGMRSSKIRAINHPILTRWRRVTIKYFTWLGLAVIAASCDRSTNGDPVPDWNCAAPADSTPDYVRSIGCMEDYQALSARPYDLSIPGVYVVKVVVDRADGNRLHLLNTRKFNTHYSFIQKNLSGNGKPLVQSVSDFNVTEYYTPHRRFVLGILGYYEKSGKWAWQLNPSDNASADLIAIAHRKIVEACFCGKDLFFLANSLNIQAEARKLPASIKVTSTDKLYASVDYQPLSNATSIGRLVLTTAGRLKQAYPGPREIVVSDSLPDGIPLVVSGIITQQFQTLISPVNVLAQERGIPNMSLRGALAHPNLRALDGKWVHFNVGAFDYSLSEATEAEAEAWWASQTPPSVTVPLLDSTEGGLQDVESILDTSLGLAESLKRAISAYGGLSGYYSALPHMDRSKLAYEPAFAIPVRYYLQHMRDNGLNDVVDRMLADPEFQTNSAERDRRLRSLREAILSAPLHPDFWKLLNDKLDETFPGLESIRFAPSTNSGDPAGLTGSGSYGSRTGGRTDPSHSIKQALLEVWAGMWDLSLFEERIHRRIDYKAVGIGALVQGNRGGVKANGVALTTNPYDEPAIWPGFYINAQVGEASMMQTNPSIIPEQILYQYRYPGQPIVLLTLSNQVPSGTTVLTSSQIHALGTALVQVQDYLDPTYKATGRAEQEMYARFKLGQATGAAPGEGPVIILDGVWPARGAW
jgi:pyruvate,water dikinase